MGNLKLSAGGKGGYYFFVSKINTEITPPIIIMSLQILAVYWYGKSFSAGARVRTNASSRAALVVTSSSSYYNPNPNPIVSKFC